MRDTPNISVILPVFNVAPYIAWCIASLQVQTLHDLEFVFVNDCSTDGSMDAVEAWAAEDDRVRILHNEENLGAGPSRNRGIEAARGAYLSFVDPDDCVAPDFYELLYAQALNTRADIVKGTRARIDQSPHGESQLRGDLNEKLRGDLKRGLPLFLHFNYEHTSAIYARHLFANPDVRYGTSSNAQDTTFLLRCCQTKPSISFEDNALYLYQHRDDSATGTHTLKRAWGELASLREKLDSLKGQPIDDATINFLQGRFATYSTNFCFARRNEEVSADDQERYIHTLKEQMARIPDQNRLHHRRPEFEVLAQYNRLLPASRTDEGRFHIERIEEWVSFLKEQPISNTWVFKEGAYAITSTVLAFLSKQPRAAYYVHDALSTTGQQIRRLDPRKRRLLKRLAAGSFVRCIEDYIFLKVNRYV